MTIRDRLQLAGQALLGMLDPENELMPTGGAEVAHDLGRWWDAALRMENAIGFEIPPELEAASLRNLHLLADNPDRLMMNSSVISWMAKSARINPHNIRESFLTYDQRWRRRQDDWARESGLVLTAAVDRLVQPDGRIDMTKLGSWGQAPPSEDFSFLGQSLDSGWFDTTGSTGRALEAMVWFYESTQEAPVLELARRIAAHHLAYTVNADGSMRKEIVDPANPGHCHSYHGTLRGMLLFGLLTGQDDYVDVVEKTYRNAVRLRMVKESGWAPHDLGVDRFSNEDGDPWSDAAVPGDSAQLALWLALRAGCDDLLDDVERLVRCRLFPAQTTEEDVRRYPDQELARNSVWAWTNHGPSHAGKTRCLNDVHAAVVHSLCEIYQSICTASQDGLSVNLHLDYEDDRVRIVSKRGQSADVTVSLTEPCALRIRIPGWAPDASVRMTVAGEDVNFKRDGVFACLPGKVTGDVVLSYDLPERASEETMVSGRVYRFQWCGDEIVGIDPQEDEGIPLYPSL
jgi:hypothetical protein